MKALVNGEEVELSPCGAEIELLQGHDRLYVRTPEGTFSALVVRAKGKTFVSFRGRQYVVEDVTRSRCQGSIGDGTSVAPMPGKIVDVLVQVGENVEKHQKLVVLEAMKTQQPIIAGFDGSVAEILVEKGQQVIEGQKLVRIEPK